MCPSISRDFCLFLLLHLWLYALQPWHWKPVRINFKLAGIWKCVAVDIWTWWFHGPIVTTCQMSHILIQHANVRTVGIALVIAQQMCISFQSQTIFHRAPTERIQKFAKCIFGMNSAAYWTFGYVIQFGETRWEKSIFRALPPLKWQMMIDSENSICRHCFSISGRDSNLMEIIIISLIRLFICFFFGVFADVLSREVEKTANKTHKHGQMLALMPIKNKTNVAMNVEREFSSDAIKCVSWCVYVASHHCNAIKRRNNYSIQQQRQLVLTGYMHNTHNSLVS